MALPNEDTKLGPFCGMCALWSGLTDLGLHADAERPMTQAVEIARQLVGEPSPEAQALLAASLYDLAGSLWRLGRYREARDLLTQSEAIYRTLEGKLDDDAPVQLWLADVLALRGQINHASGQRASAVMDLDEAVAQALGAPEAHHAAHGHTDLARLLSINAKMLAGSGDPDLALESAQEACRLLEAARGSGHAGPAHTPGWALAASLVIEIRAAAGHKERVENLAGQAVELERARHAQGHGEGDALAQALVRQAMVLTGSGNDALAARAMQEAHKLSQRSAAQAELAMREGPRSYLGLAAALKVAGEALSPEKALARAGAAAIVADTGTLAEAPAHRAPLTPSQRLARLGLGATAACRDLAQLGCELMAQHKPQGLRLALEACYGLRAATKRSGGNPPPSLAEVGPIWGQALLACSQAFAAAGDLPMALDLAHWGEELAQGLLAVAPRDEGQPQDKLFIRIAAQLMEQHAQLSGTEHEPPEPTAGVAPPTLEAAP